MTAGFYEWEDVSRMAQIQKPKCRSGKMIGKNPETNTERKEYGDFVTKSTIEE